MRSLSLLSLAVGAAALAACTTPPTPYGPALIDQYGYTDQKIEQDRFRVTFAGNSKTDREQVENYLLFRAAEVTLQNGYDHFVIAKDETETLITYRTNTLGTGFSPYGYFGFHHGGAGAAGSDSTARPIPSYEASAVIVARKGEKPDEDVNAYDARAVIESIGPTVIRGYDDGEPVTAAGEFDPAL